MKKVRLPIKQNKIVRNNLINSKVNDRKKIKNLLMLVTKSRII